MSMAHGKLDVSASTRLPPEWNEIITESQEKRAAWIREAVKQRLIAENLIQFSHNQKGVSRNTLNTLNPRKNTSVFRVLFDFISKYHAQKKPDGNRTFSVINHKD